jgi:Holliday junction resolvase RusA-like endonuclease
MIVRLEFPTNPQPKQRSRVRILDPRRPEWATSSQRKTTSWTPEATRRFEEEIRVRAQSELHRLGLRMPLVPAPAPAFVATTFWLSRPKTGPAAVLEWPTSQADLDNLCKALWDSLGERRSRGVTTSRGVAWTDDSQVVWSQETKLFAAPGQRQRITLVVADLEGVDELVRSAGDAATRRFSPASGPAAVWSAASR